MVVESTGCVVLFACIAGGPNSVMMSEFKGNKIEASTLVMLFDTLTIFYVCFVSVLVSSYSYAS